jgi:hypothetical protein
MSRFVFRAWAQVGGSDGRRLSSTWLGRKRCSILLFGLQFHDFPYNR